MEDREAIVAVAQDYIEAWLDSDADRLARSLHPEVRKRSVKDPAAGTLDLDELEVPPWLDRVRARGPQAYSRDVEVRVLGVYDHMAAVEVLSEPFMDYLHLARFDGRWLIVNVLWQERPPEG
jgi:Putative lumazine-binding